VTTSKVRARVSYKNKNYEKTVRNKEEAKKWKARMLTDLERAPLGASFVRGLWVAELPTATTPATYRSKDLQDVIDWLLRTKAELAVGVYIDQGTAELTLSGFSQVWENQKVRAQPRTMQGYLLLLKNHILPNLGDRKIASLSSVDVRNWVGDLVRQEVGAPTIHKCVALLKQILKTAFDDEIIRRNPVVGIELPPLIPSDKKPLTAAELGALSRLCKGFETMVMLMGLMGLRISEVRALTAEDFDVNNWELTVRAGFTHDLKYRRTKSTTKTKSVRQIPIPEPLRPALLKHLATLSSTSHVFTGVKGGVLNDSWFRKRVFSPAVKALGLSKVTLHTLRHTCASLLISSGASITSVSRILGHSSVVQTLNTYSHYYKEDVEVSMTKLGDLYSRGLAA
jgi:integrase